jgi:HEAT repeat protein
MRWALLLLVVPASGQENDAARRVEQARALGASYPDGTSGVGLLIDMLDDDDPAVREAASRSLVALGRKGLAELVRYVTNPRDPTYPALLQTAELTTKLGVALILDDLCEFMSADQPASRRAGAAVAILATSSGRRRDCEFMIDILANVRQDADAKVTAMVSASLAVLGWNVVAGEHPASAADVEDLVPLLEHPSLGAVCACVIALLCPRADWPEQVAAHGFGSTAAGPESPEPVDTLRERLRELGSASARTEATRPSLLIVLRALRSKGSAASAAKPDLEELLGSAHGALRVEVANTLLAVVPAETEAPARALGEVLLNPDDAADEFPYRDAPAEAIAILAGMGAAARPAVPGLIAVLGWSEDLAGLKNWRVVNLKRATASILGHVGAREAAPALKALSDNGDARLRHRAETALRRIGPS